MAPQLRCKCIWALATLAHCPDRAWLAQLAGSAFQSSDVAQLAPGDLSDALWALYTLETLADQQQAGQQQPAAGENNDRSSTDSTTSSQTSSVLTRELLQSLDSKLLKRVHELQPSQVVRLMELAEGASERVQGYRLPRGIGEQMSAALSARATAVSDTAGVLKLAWAAANLELPLHGSAKEHICRKLYSQLDSLSATDMARGFWASAKLRYG